MKRIFIAIILLLFFVQGVLALTANSSNYSVNLFGTGMATATPSSANYNSTVLTETEGTTRNAESGTYMGNIGFFSDTSYHVVVSITSYTIYPKSAVSGSIIRLSISALNSQSVWAVLTLPNSTQETIILTNNGNSYYTANSVGVYTAAFYANSSRGNIASVIDAFEITSPTSATIPTRGGGGTTTITKNCTYIWDCSPWNICSEKKQTRECKNTGTCIGTEGKPAEERTCSDALFDVNIKFKDLEITQNDTLKFDVNLTERGGVEKIDVQIKYSIISSDNTEIFSQIETLEIKGNLNYEKEIKEVKLTDGEYILRIDILYGNLQKAFAEQKFEVKKEGLKLSFNEKIFIGGIIIAFLILLVILIIPFRSWLMKKRWKKSLEKIISKPILIVLFSLVAIGFLFALRKNIIGLVVSDSVSKSSNWNIAGFVLIAGILGLLVFVYRKKIAEKIENKRRDKPDKNSLNGLIKKEVYTEEGNYVGNVDEIILEKNKIHSLKIKLNKKEKFKVKGIVIKYKNVQSVGNVVIVDNLALKA